MNAFLFFVLFAFTNPPVALHVLRCPFLSTFFWNEHEKTKLSTLCFLFYCSLHCNTQTSKTYLPDGLSSCFSAPLQTLEMSLGGLEERVAERLFYLVLLSLPTSLFFLRVSIQCVVVRPCCWVFSVGVRGICARMDGRMGRTEEHGKMLGRVGR